jgi:chromosome segregation ATPase
LIREAVAKESSASSLDALNTLWQELEQIYSVLQDAKEALPAFVDKQKENLELFTNVMVTEASQASREQLMAQHKKLDLQYDVILGQHQSFREYKARVDSQLDELDGLREHSSQLASENNTLFANLDAMAKEAKTADEEHSAKLESMEKELAELLASKKELTDEGNAAKKTVSDFQDKLKATEQKVTDQYETEIRRLKAECSNERTKAAALDIMIKALRAGDKKAEDKSLSELKLIQEKYKNQSNEYAKIFAVSGPHKHILETATYR